MLFCCFSCGFIGQEYLEDIRAYAQSYGVDPALVAAIAKCESGFDPNAVSSAGAIGIMQIMPPTGKWIAEVLCESNYSVDLLKDPQIGLKFGAFYLSYLSGKFSEEWQVIAAYNAGEGVVAKWISENITEDRIPFRETADYLKRVKRTLRSYRNKKLFAFD